MVAVHQTVERHRTRVERHDAEPGRWECVQEEPDPRLRAYVGDYQGYIEQAARPVWRLEERLFEASTWESRFAIFDGFIAARIREARPASPDVAWAWQQLRQADGALEVGMLAAELGWSRKHLVARFRDQIGLPPKRVARILRFNCMVRFLDRANAPGWAEIAHECGYYDQSHLIRDVHHFARCTPIEFLQRRQDPEVVLGA